MASVDEVTSRSAQVMDRQQREESVYASESEATDRIALDDTEASDWPEDAEWYMDTILAEAEWDVEEGRNVVQKTHYLVKWTGYSKYQASWEPVEKFHDAGDVMFEWQEKRAKIQRGWGEAFDTEQWEEDVDELRAKRRRRHERRNKKRRKLGLPEVVYPDDDEEDEEQEDADDELESPASRSARAEEVEEEGEVPRTVARQKKSRRAEASDSDDESDAGDDSDEAASRRHKRQKVSRRDQHDAEDARRRRGTAVPVKKGTQDSHRPRATESSTAATRRPAAPDRSTSTNASDSTALARGKQISNAPTAKMY